jgi:hypothetical protein
LSIAYRIRIGGFNRSKRSSVISARQFLNTTAARRPVRQRLRTRADHVSTVSAILWLVSKSCLVASNTPQVPRCSRIFGRSSAGAGRCGGSGWIWVRARDAQGVIRISDRWQEVVVGAGEV